MASLPFKLIFDIIEDRIYDVIVKVRDEQVIIDPLVNFNVEKERITDLSPSELPFVNINFISELTKPSTTSRMHQGMSLFYDIGMFAYVKGGDTFSSDLLSAKRLYYLAAQVKEALTRLLETDLGFVPGIIAKRKFPEFQKFEAGKAKDDSEILIAAGKFSLEIETSFTSEDITLLDLDEITVDTKLFQVHYTY